MQVEMEIIGSVSIEVATREQLTFYILQVKETKRLDHERSTPPLELAIVLQS